MSEMSVEEPKAGSVHYYATATGRSVRLVSLNYWFNYFCVDGELAVVGSFVNFWLAMQWASAAFFLVLMRR